MEDEELNEMEREIQELQDIIRQEKALYARNTELLRYLDNQDESPAPASTSHSHGQDTTHGPGRVASVAEHTPVGLDEATPGVSGHQEPLKVSMFYGELQRDETDCIEKLKLIQAEKDFLISILKSWDTYHVGEDALLGAPCSCKAQSCCCEGLSREAKDVISTSSVASTSSQDSWVTGSDMSISQDSISQTPSNTESDFHLISLSGPLCGRNYRTPDEFRRYIKTQPGVIGNRDRAVSGPSIAPTRMDVPSTSYEPLATIDEAPELEEAYVPSITVSEGLSLIALAEESVALFQKAEEDITGCEELLQALMRVLPPSCKSSK